MVTWLIQHSAQYPEIVVLFDAVSAKFCSNLCHDSDIALKFKLCRNHMSKFDFVYCNKLLWMFFTNPVKLKLNNKETKKWQAISNATFFLGHGVGLHIIYTVGLE